MFRRLVRSASVAFSLASIAGAQALDEYTIFASQSAVLMDRSACLSVCLMGAGGTMRIGADAMADGDVRAVGTINVADRGRIQGTATTADVVVKQSGSSVGIINAGAQVVLPTIPGLPVSYGTTDINIYNGQSLDLAPGSWGRIHVYAGGTVRLVGGTYQVRSLQLEADGKVGLDVAAADIDFRASDGLWFGDRSKLTLANGSEYKVKWYSAQVGQLRIGTDVVFRGILTAPAADVSIASRCYLHGGMRARTVSLEPDSRILRVLKPTETTPVFTSAPTWTEFGTGTDIEFYCPTAKDPKGLPVTITLNSSVENLKQNANGCLQFAPKRWQDNKLFSVQLKATNSAGYSSFQDFKISTFSMEHSYSLLPATFTNKAKVGQQWVFKPGFIYCSNETGTNNRCDVETMDDDGDVVNYKVSGLPGATIVNRVIYWTPTAAGNYSMKLEWSDLRNGNYSGNYFGVTVSP
ncbi:MAG: hypothetical protein RL318_1424 [Fibrobacterota bacterium]|jgi:hypothetical protein